MRSWVIYDRFPRLHLWCLRSLTSLGASRQRLASLADFQPDTEYHHSGAVPAVQPNRDLFIFVRLNIFKLSNHLPRTQRTKSSKMLSRLDEPIHTGHQVTTTTDKKASNNIHWKSCPWFSLSIAMLARVESTRRHRLSAKYERQRFS